ncbi:Helix-turn-helix motif protein [Beggiatoa sp. SS]|nr:Helix-turn-helix motif protein [Beggiatoa sp. SS]
MNITKRKRFSPGEMLLEEFMQPLNLSSEQLAERNGVPVVQRIDEVDDSQKGITPDMTMRLSRMFGTSVPYWLSMQFKMDLWLSMNDHENPSGISTSAGG